MNKFSNDMNEVLAAEAFSKQSEVFDHIYGEDAIINYKRERVRQHILRFAKDGGSMLELNCGTGEDAVYFSKKGFRIHATDISPLMLEKLEEKSADASLKNLTTEIYSFTQPQTLNNKGPYDYVYSNFGGLNCTGELHKVLSSLSALVKPGGMVTLVVISNFCLWELLLVFRGKFKTAFRRFFSKKGRKAHVEGTFFKCWYYSPSYVRKHLKKDFENLGTEGLCTLVPPSYMEGFGDKHAGLFSYLRKKEDKWKARWPWRRMGDYFIISFRRC